MRIIDRIDKLLKEKGLMAKELANAIGVSTGNVSEWRKGRATPSSDVVAKIAVYLNVSSDYLLGLTNDDLEENDFYIVLGSYLQKLNDEEKQAIMSFFRMNEQEKSIVMKLINDIIKLRKK